MRNVYFNLKSQKYPEKEQISFSSRKKNERLKIRKHFLKYSVVLCVKCTTLEFLLLEKQPNFFKLVICLKLRQSYPSFHALNMA